LFEIGDEIIITQDKYYLTIKGSIGTIISPVPYHNNELYRVKFSFGEFTINAKVMELYEPEQTKKTPIERKCRKLWNLSNYVKSNPTMAY
jgi:hypothetical protein